MFVDSSSFYRDHPIEGTPARVIRKGETRVRIQCGSWSPFILRQPEKDSGYCLVPVRPAILSTCLMTKHSAISSVVAGSSCHHPANTVVTSASPRIFASSGLCQRRRRCFISGWCPGMMTVLLSLNPPTSTCPDQHLGKITTVKQFHPIGSRQFSC